MKKNVLVLTGDYWHPSDSIKPLIELMFSDSEWNVNATENPDDQLLPVIRRRTLLTRSM